MLLLKTPKKAAGSQAVPQNFTTQGQGSSFQHLGQLIFAEWLSAQEPWGIWMKDKTFLLLCTPKLDDGWWLIKPQQSSFKPLINIEPGWYTLLPDAQSIPYHFMVNPLHFLIAEAHAVRGFTCPFMWRSNFTKHCLAKPKLSWKTSWLPCFGEKQKTPQKTTKKKKDSSQSTTHFDFQGTEEDQTMNKQSPITWWWRGSSQVVPSHHKG